MQKLLGEYAVWLESSNARKGKIYREYFENKWPSVAASVQSQLKASEFLRMKHELSIKVIEDFSSAAASKVFDQEIREVVSWSFSWMFILVCVSVRMVISCD